MFKPRTIKSAGQCGRAMHAPTGLIDVLLFVCRGRHPWRPVYSAQCYPRLPPRGGSRASGWRSLRNKRRCACFEIAIIPLSRTLPQAPSPPALDVLLAKLDRCLQHDSRREPFICGTPRTSSPTGLVVSLRIGSRINATDCSVAFFVIFRLVAVSFWR